MCMVTMFVCMTYRIKFDMGDQLLSHENKLVHTQHTMFWSMLDNTFDVRQIVHYL